MAVRGSSLRVSCSQLSKVTHLDVEARETLCRRADTATSPAHQSGGTVWTIDVGVVLSEDSQNADFLCHICSKQYDFFSYNM
jgi:hypothetical protein